MPLAAKLAGHHPVHVIDLSGFGLSCNPGRVLNVAEYADHLADWLEQGLAAVPAARRLDIRYEALVAEPLATMRQLAAFAGLADRRDWVQELARLRYPNRNEHAYSQLNPQVRGRIEAIQGDDLRRLGYLG